MPITINFTGVQTLEVMPVGIYSVVVTAVDEQEGVEFPYLAWEFTIDSGDYENRKLWSNTSISPKALWKLKEVLIALGVPAETLDAEVSFDPQDFIGRRALAVVNIEPRTDTGELRNTVVKLQAKSPTAKEKAVDTAAKPVQKLKFK